MQPGISIWIRRRSLGILVAGLLVVAIVVGWYVAHSRPPAPDQSLQRVQRAGVLVVGIDPSYPPFEVVDKSGHLSGFDIDLATEVAHRLGVRVKFVSVDFGSIFDALEVGKFDVIVGGVSPSSDYEKRVSFGIPYFDDGLVLVEKPTVANHIVGIESGSDADMDQNQLRKMLPNDQFKQFSYQSEIRDGLQQGTLRGSIVDAVTADKWASQIPGLVVDQQRLTHTPYVFAVRRSDQKLLRGIDAAIKELQVGGQIQQLERTWLRQ